MLKNVRTTVILSVVILLLLSAQAFAFKFALIGDVQGGDEILTEIITRINARDDIVFVVQTGDMSRKGSAEEFEHYLKLLHTLKVPVKHVCGNHDRGTDKAYFEKYCGKAYYSWDYEGCHFTVFDNSRDVLDKEQKAWLEKDLTASKAQHKYVFAHKPVYSPNCRHCMGEWDDAAKTQVLWLENLFSRTKVTKVFAGHIHAFRDEGVYKGVHYYVGGGGGARLYRVPTYEAVHHYLVVDTQTQEVTMIKIPSQKQEKDKNWKP